VDTIIGDTIVLLRRARFDDRQGPPADQRLLDNIAAWRYNHHPGTRVGNIPAD
jgi:hypothetical protein